MSVYADQLRAHLVEYKRHSLGVKQDGIWRNNGRAYGHILPEESQEMNVLEPYRMEFWKYLRGRYEIPPLHTDFHHLNSSQAFAFNLLFPFVAEPDLAPILLDALGVEAVEFADPEFEYMPDPSEKTTVDFTVLLDGRRRLLIEVKLTEAEFGTCQPNEARIRKLREDYPRMLHGKVIEGSYEQSHFFQNYQLYRNVAHVVPERGDRLVLLLPRANTLTWQQGERFVSERLLESVKPHVALVAAEDVVRGILDDPRCTPRMRSQYQRLREKYLPA